MQLPLRDKETGNPKQQLGLYKNEILAPLQEVNTPLQVEKQPRKTKILLTFSYPQLIQMI